MTKIIEIYYNKHRTQILIESVVTATRIRNKSLRYILSGGIVVYMH